MKKHILIVEDESDIASALAARLKNEGFAVSVADNGDDGLDLALSEDYDLALLDIMLPGKDGLEIASALREKKDTAILVLSARDEENDIISGLDIGADDYVTKPFSLREVVARVHALMRRRDASRLTRFTATDELTFGDLYIDGRAHLVKLNSKIVHVTPTEFRLFPISPIKKTMMRLQLTQIFVLSIHMYDRFAKKLATNTFVLFTQLVIHLNHLMSARKRAHDEERSVQRTS
jgi:DNA-binding response OmpR family regulator